MSDVHPAGIVFEKITEKEIEVTVWACFGNGPFSPECKRNCSAKIFKKCELFVEAGKCIAIEDEMEFDDFGVKEA